VSGNALPHALGRAAEWRGAWRRSGGLVLLLDLDGTLAPIATRPELAAVPVRTRAALDRLLGAPGVRAAVVSGRGVADAREHAGIPGIAYAGNHGMEMEGPGLRRVHPEARAARPELEAAAAALGKALAEVPGAFLEDKGLTLSVHFRLAPADRLRLTAGKMVLEVRPRVEWDKGRAVLFLLDHLRPPPAAPVLYLGDDATDEDAFRALAERGGAGEGIVVAESPPADTAARSWLRSPEEVAALFEALAG
jgi:trehalose 6-phosphate phosphatase